ncbi:MAG: SAM-dependent methyltransferase [Candidatus Peregrinibacteria bacterium Greene0416_62]|nr:MAG: SAM-dependent methyltransferase [Candidatus Peregrinibacteria bacterium Greene0416_62]
MFIDFVLAGLVLMTVLIAITFIAHLWVPVVYVPTPHAVVKEMVELADLKPGDRVYDLGAGDARLLIAAKRKEPGITAIGCELIPTVWAFGQFCIWKSGQKVTLRFQNILRCDLRDADCVFLYLIPSLMEKLKEKFDQELRPGTRVVAYVFKIPGKEPEKEVKVPWMGGERAVRVYRW